MSRLLLLLLALLVAGCSRGGESSSGSPQRPGPAADPGVRAALAVVALERDPATALTAEQAAKILPWLRVLRDMRPDDVAAAQPIADEVFSVLTPEQRSALQRLQEENRARRSSPGGQGAGPPGARPPGVGDGSAPDPARRAEFRRRLIERAIRLLEAKSSR